MTKILLDDNGKAIKIGTKLAIETTFDHLAFLKSNKLLKGSQGLYTGKVQVGRLPSGYQEVEYIESSGTQYIDTGYKPNNNSKVIISGYKNNTTSLFLTDSGWDNLMFGIGDTYIGWKIAYASHSSSLMQGTHIWELSQNGLVIDGATQYTPPTQTFQCQYDMFLFGFERNGTVTSAVTMKLYYCKLYESGTLVRDFIPCYRKSDSVIGLYDLVNNQFYTNAGTGTFSKGNNV